MLYLYILDGNCSVVSITDAIFWTAAFLLVVLVELFMKGVIIWQKMNQQKIIWRRFLY